MRFEVTILGSGAATPAHGRFLTSQVVNVREQLFLVDCGEATQFRLNDLRIKSYKIQHIFISHLHGDHIFGLMGLLLSWSLNQRVTPVTIYSPQDLSKFVELQLQTTHTELSFPLHFQQTNPNQSELVYENDWLTVHSIPLLHRIPCNGYFFREKLGLRRIRRDQVDLYKIPLTFLPKIKIGESYTQADGTILPNEDLTLPPLQPRSYAFCSDTKYNEAILPIIQNVDVLYHESTFLHNLLSNAEQTQHTTALQAAMIAQKANAKLLLLGHFSARYDELSPLLDEARSLFTNTELAIDGKIISIPPVAMGD